MKEMPGQWSDQSFGKNCRRRESRLMCMSRVRTAWRGLARHGAGTHGTRRNRSGCHGTERDRACSIGQTERRTSVSALVLFCCARSLSSCCFLAMACCLSRSRSLMATSFAAALAICARVPGASASTRSRRRHLREAMPRSLH